MLVAVYGTLKEGHGNHRVLEDSSATKVGITETAPEYTMYHLGGFPAITEGGNTGIHIEVYDVPDLARLDMLEGYPTLYNRKQIDTKFGEAWIYFMEDRKYLSNREVIEHGIW